MTATPESLSQGVWWDQDFHVQLGGLGALAVHEQLGFLTSAKPVDADGRVLVIGFGVPGWQGGDTTPPEARSVTDFAALPLGLQTIAHQGRGVGLRLYNAPEAVAGAAEHYYAVCGYAGLLDPHAVADRTHQRTAQIYMHRAGLEVRSKLFGVERTVASVHKRLGYVEAVVYDQPPDGRRKQQARGYTPTGDERLMVVRDPAILFTRVATRKLT